MWQDRKLFQARTDPLRSHHTKGGFATSYFHLQSELPVLTTQHLLLVFTTMPDEASARALARDLVTQRLAACVSILPAMHSVYQWQEKLEESQEVGLHIKTTQARYTELQAAILAAHPYDVPEIIAIPVAAGLPSYLDWVAQETARPRVV